MLLTGLNTSAYTGLNDQQLKLDWVGMGLDKSGSPTVMNAASGLGNLTRIGWTSERTASMSSVLLDANNNNNNGNW